MGRQHRLHSYREGSGGSERSHRAQFGVQLAAGLQTEEAKPLRGWRRFDPASYLTSRTLPRASGSPSRSGQTRPALPQPAGPTSASQLPASLHRSFAPAPPPSPRRRGVRAGRPSALLWSSRSLSPIGDTPPSGSREAPAKLSLLQSARMNALSGEP